MARPKNGPLLSKERIVETAVHLIEQEGEETVSMRRLARELNVNPMALYHHVPNRDALIAEIVEAVSSELALPVNDGLTWQERIVGVSHAYRQLAHTYPKIFPMMLAYPEFVPSDLRLAEACLESFAEAGLPPAVALNTLGTFQAYIEGFVLDELTHDRDDLLLAGLTLPNTGDFPRLEQAVGLSNRTTRDEAFRFGLVLLVKGLESLIQRRLAAPLRSKRFE